MKIYTRRGDSGATSLFSGERVDKHALRVEGYGTLDELNSCLGLAHSRCRDSLILRYIERLQNELFNAGADMATSLDSSRKTHRLKETDWRALEEAIDRLEAELPPLRNFILPGGTDGAAHLHLARSVCRRGERLAVRLMREEDLNQHLVTYLNRLSDLLFVMARYENVRAGAEETLWKG